MKKRRIHWRDSDSPVEIRYSHLKEGFPELEAHIGNSEEIYSSRSSLVAYRDLLNKAIELWDSALEDLVQMSQKDINKDYEERAKRAHEMIYEAWSRGDWVDPKADWILKRFNEIFPELEEARNIAIEKRLTAKYGTVE